LEYRKLKIIGILLFFLQLVGIGMWFYITQPAMDLSMETLQIILLLFGINLLIGLALHLLKKKDLAKMMIGNSILCPIIFFAGWILWFTYYAQ
jgi:hypothetical protein